MRTTVASRDSLLRTRASSMRAATPEPSSLAPGASEVASSAPDARESR